MMHTFVKCILAHAYRKADRAISYGSDASSSKPGAQQQPTSQADGGTTLHQAQAAVLSPPQAQRWQTLPDDLPGRGCTRHRSTAFPSFSFTLPSLLHMKRTPSQHVHHATPVLCAETGFATCQLIAAQLNSDAPCEPESLSQAGQHASYLCADILTALTGRRHFPEELPETCVSTAERPESFGMRSTQDMYRDFPAAVRSSFPLYVRTAGPQVRPKRPPMVLTA